jgi:hypothetical protein
VQSLALGEATRLRADSAMGLQRYLQVALHALPLALGQMSRALEALLGRLGQCSDGASQCQKLLFGLAHQADEDFALAPALAAKAAHDLGEILVERVGLAL